MLRCISFALYFFWKFGDCIREVLYKLHFYFIFAHSVLCFGPPPSSLLCYARCRGDRTFLAPPWGLNQGRGVSCIFFHSRHFPTPPTPFHSPTQVTAYYLAVPSPLISFMLCQKLGHATLFRNEHGFGAFSDLLSPRMSWWLSWAPADQLWPS